MRRLALLVLVAAIAAAHGGDAVPSGDPSLLAEAADRGDDFATIMPTLDDAGRIEALALIGGHRIAAASGVVAGCLESANRDVRIAALRAVGALPAEPETRSRAREALRDADPGVRRAALACVAATDDRRAAPDLADLLADGALSESAHAALVRLAGGNDLGRLPDAWKQWHDERRASADASLAALRERLESGDKSVVLAALPDIPLIDAEQDQKKRLAEPLRADADPAVASAAEAVWRTVVTGSPVLDAQPTESAPVAAPPEPVAIAAPAPAPRRLARGDLVLLVSCAAAITVGVGLFVLLVRNGREITKRFTRVISVQLRKKGGAKSEPSSALQAATQKVQSDRVATARTATSVRTEAIKPKSDRTAAISGERSGAAKVISDRVTAAKTGGERSGAAKVVSDRMTAAKPATERSGAAKVISDRIDAAKASSDRTAAVKAVSERIAAVKSADATKPTSERVPAVPTSPSKP